VKLKDSYIFVADETMPLIAIRGQGLVFNYDLDFQMNQTKRLNRFDAKISLTSNDTPLSV